VLNPPPLTITCVAFVELSKISRASCNEQGGRGVVAGTVTWTAARIAARPPVDVADAKGRRADEIWPAVNVNGLALPTAVPAVFLKRTEPVQDAAVPAALFAATLITLISTVSPLPNAIAGKSYSRVVAVVCAKAEDTPIVVVTIIKNVRLHICFTWLSFLKSKVPPVR